MHHFQNNSPYKRSTTWARINGETIFGNWIKHKNYTYPQVAELIGVSVRSVKYWSHGQALPCLLSAFKIDQISKGAVPPASWLDTEIAKAKWHNPHVQEKHEKPSVQKSKPGEKKAHVVLPVGAQHSPQDSEGGVHSVVLRPDGERGSNSKDQAQAAKEGPSKRQDLKANLSGKPDRKGDEEARIAGGRATSPASGRRQPRASKHGKAGGTSGRKRQPRKA